MQIGRLSIIKKIYINSYNHFFIINSCYHEAFVRGSKLRLDLFYLLQYIILKIYKKRKNHNINEF